MSFLRGINPSALTNEFNAIFSDHIPTCRSEMHETMNITRICNHLTLVHLVKITSLNRQLQVRFRCTKNQSWSG